MSETEDKASRSIRMMRALGLSDEEINEKLLILLEAQLHPDSAAGTEIAIAAHMEQLAMRIPQAIEEAAREGALRGSDEAAKVIQSNARLIIGDVTKAAEILKEDAAGHVFAAKREAEAAADNLRAETKRFENTVERSKATASALATDVQAAILDSVNTSIVQAAVTNVKTSRNKWALATMGIAAAVGLTFAGLGYFQGRQYAQSTVASLEAVYARGDGPTLIKLAEMNDFVAALAAYCGPGKLRQLEGGKSCNLPLWVSREAAPPAVFGRSVDISTILEAAGDWLYVRLGPWGLIGSTVGLLLFIRAILGGACRVKFIRWLFALPANPVTGYDD